MRILVVEDEIALSEALEQILKKNKYSVDLAHNGESGLNHALSGIHDLILLDIMLPRMDGLSVLRELRKAGIATPVILLTAKGEVSDKVTGLDSGADDYLAKPFATEELLARVRAASRRRADVPPEDTLKFADIELNPSTLVLTSGGKEVKLILKEKELLELLIARKDMATPKGLILEKLWGYDSEAVDNHAEVYVSFLRKKLAFLGSRAGITTIRGIGYRLEAKK
jgi:DNA-binding response OmpR family regulator